MIIGSVEIQIFFISQFRDHIRISAGLICISRIREKRIQDHTVQNTIRWRKSSLHLIINNSVIRKLPICFLQVIIPALLPEDLFVFINIRMQNCVHIHVHQILKILFITACNRIYCLVRISHRIQKGVQRSFYQFHKRILGRKLFRATQNSMFHDMWHSGTVRCRCAESDIKYFIFIIIGDQKHPRTTLFMS